MPSSQQLLSERGGVEHNPTHCTCRAHTVHILCTCRAHAVHVVRMLCTYPGVVPLGTPTRKAAQPMLCTIVEKASTCCVYHAMSASATCTCECEYAWHAYTEPWCTAHEQCIQNACAIRRLCIYHALLYTRIEDTLRNTLRDAPCCCRRRPSSAPRRSRRP